MATVWRVPVEFLTDEQAAAYGRFVEEPTRPELERFFYLDDGIEDQLGALGLILNAAVLWTTRYLDAAVTALRALLADQREHEVLDEDIATHSPVLRVTGAGRGRCSATHRRRFAPGEVAGDALCRMAAGRER